MARIETVERLREIIADYGPRGAAKIRDHVCEQGRAFIEGSPLVLLGTIGAGGIEISPKGDHAGFVEQVNARELLIPERPGNHLCLSLQNILDDPRVGLMFLRPATDEVLRVSGRATLHDDAELCERLRAGGKPAVLAIRVVVERAAFHCARSLRRARLWDPASWDAPTRISFGRIYAEALGQAELEETFDRLSAESDAKLY